MIRIATAILASLLSVTASGAASTITVGGARIHYEVYGAGPTVVLLHGGLFGSVSEFSALIPELSRTRKVIAIHTRGHGLSELGSARLSYELFARDAAEIIRASGGGRVDLIGFSDGAITAYHLAATWPSLVRRVVAAGGPLGIDGYTAAGLAALDRYDSPADLESFAPSFVNTQRARMSKGRWNRFVIELAAMWREKNYISRDKIKGIACPVLLVAGDRDEYASTEHLVEIYRLLPHGQLAILPGTGHLVFKSKPAIVSSLVRAFLDAS